MRDTIPGLLVVDASAAIAIIREEVPGLAAAGLISRHRLSGGQLLVPDHFWLEVANVLLRRYAARPEQVVNAFLSMDELEVESVRLDRPHLLLVLDFQARFALSSYDAAYLALAESTDARLLTLDRRLADAAGRRAVPLPDFNERGTAEVAAPYGAEPLDWARFGPYLARLRAEASDLIGLSAEGRLAARRWLSR